MVVWGPPMKAYGVCERKKKVQNQQDTDQKEEV